MESTVSPIQLMIVPSLPFNFQSQWFRSAEEVSFFLLARFSWEQGNKSVYILVTNASQTGLIIKNVLTLNRFCLGPQLTQFHLWYREEKVNPNLNLGVTSKNHLFWREMTTLSDLPPDLVKEILSRVPLRSLRSIRSTCKQWNILSKDGTFLKKLIKQQQGKRTIWRLCWLTLKVCVFN